MFGTGGAVTADDQSGSDVGGSEPICDQRHVGTRLVAQESAQEAGPAGQCRLEHSGSQ